MIGQGEPVIAVAGMRIEPLRTTGSSVIVGVAQNHWVSGTSESYDLWVFDDPTQLFAIQDNGATLVTAGIGGNFSFTAFAAANSTTLRSKAELDGATENVAVGTVGDADRPLRVIGTSRQENKKTATATSSWTGAIVQFNSEAHILAKSTNKGI
jgi:hypothetical protein